ncbi:hypothetical protein GIB67_030341 [Kingdonia uniflora]|uniref:Uncharacterized protein n=1 Tax=Kingdonia uniflora TaxID=39325 RepID=A0A7J7M6V1_9MAGN|nr:hypothetical protein GIB67_030341 [Kingdonia uniflora]
MLHTFFLKPFNLLSTLIFLLRNQEVLPLSPSNPKRTTPSTFFLVNTNSLQCLPQMLHLCNIISLRAFNIHSLFIDFLLGHLQNMYHGIIHRFRSNLLQKRI